MLVVREDAVADRPPTNRDRALKRGADELMNLCEWSLRRRPRALKRARARYADLCVYLHRAIGRRR
jgi:hypothetical protein